VWFEERKIKFSLPIDKNCKAIKWQLMLDDLLMDKLEIYKEGKIIF
jgi:hypothetical protein